MERDQHRVEFNELASRYMTENIRLWQRYADVMRRLSQGQLRGDNVPQELGELARNDGADFLRNVMQLNLNYYSMLLDLSADLTNRFFEKIIQPEPAPAAPVVETAPADKPKGPGFELVFSGPTGRVTSNSFVVANKQAEATNVSFELSEFRSEDGATRLRVPVEFVPEQFVLAPGAEQIIECRVPIEPAFLPGSRYMALGRVTGFPAMDFALIVIPTAETSTPAPDAKVQPMAQAPAPVDTTADSMPFQKSQPESASVNAGSSQDKARKRRGAKTRQKRTGTRRGAASGREEKS